MRDRRSGTLRRLSRPVYLLSASYAAAPSSYVVFASCAYAQTTAVIPANEAAAHIGEYATAERVVAKVFTRKTGNTFLNWLDPARIAGEEVADSIRDRGKARQNH